MSRSPWKPKTDAQEVAWAELKRLARRAADAEAALWAAIPDARVLDIPDLAIEQLPGVSRATLNRKLGRRSAPRNSGKSGRSAE